ncbi:hypothetical protein J6590_039958 [Homalodisca vitripennis]|nr:hypothetical protein J6590_039958 [Homalodisca vitripennis]
MQWWTTADANDGRQRGLYEWRACRELMRAGKAVQRGELPTSTGGCLVTQHYKPVWRVNILISRAESVCPGSPPCTVRDPPDSFVAMFISNFQPDGQATYATLTNIQRTAAFRGDLESGLFYVTKVHWTLSPAH